MVPSAFVVLKEFPLTSNGKVDRKALPEPDVLRCTSPSRPLSKLELQLTAIWEQVLDIHGIDLTDNFFDLGGNSLDAVRLFSQLRKLTGRDLPLATLFQAPTIESLATVLSSEGWEPAWNALVAIQPNGNRTPLFIIPGVGGNVLMFAHLANHLGSDQPVYGLQSRGHDGKVAPFERIEEIASYYIEDIREVQPQGPYLLAGACMGGVVAYEMAQQLMQSDDEVELLALIDTGSLSGLHPNLIRLRQMFYPLVFLTAGIVRHVRGLLAQPIHQWWTYLRDKTKIVEEMIEDRDIFRGDSRELYKDRVSSANYRATARYVPTKHNGKLHIFYATEQHANNKKSNPLVEWGSLATDGYTTYAIEARDSGDMFTEPAIQEFSRQLRDVIVESKAS